MRVYFFAPLILSGLTFVNASLGTHFPGASLDTTLNVTSNYADGNGVGIHAQTNVNQGIAVSAQAAAPSGIGVQATSAYGMGVRATGGTYGVFGTGPAAGVTGTSTRGDGVLGNSTTGAGLRGVSANYYGVYGESPFSGVMGIALSNGPGVTGRGSIGVYGRGVAAMSSNGVGVYAWGSGGGTAYGIIATADSGKNENWAGWFDGNVAITGTCSPCVISDARTKRNIKTLRGSLKKILAMEARSYEMKNAEYASAINLAQGPQNGLIAQELEAIVPEAVHEVVAPPHYTQEERERGVKKEGVLLKSVNYTALIPLLIAAIQEQQAEIEALKARR
ncbi:MAG: hypothetical protein K0Q91_1947 [Fibrobacteria bacterium]|jgi:hypothetical protein|nr:hypothetical protein [Fibrobacteria bacterium]